MSAGPSEPASLADTEGENSASDAGAAALLEDFPIDKQNPFEAAACGSNLVLIVEGKKLHVHRDVLSLYCHYFRVMLSSEHFVEARSKEIELKSNELVAVKHDAMVKFLLQLYPMSSVSNIRNDQTLADLFPLAEYFQCKHVSLRCEAYIGQQLQQVGDRLTAYSALLYLRLCIGHGVKKYIEGCLDILTRKRLPEVRAEEQFVRLSPELQRTIIDRRADHCETLLAGQKEKVNRWFENTRANGEYRCCKCGESSHFGICQSCRTKLQLLLQSD